MINHFLSAIACLSQLVAKLLLIYVCLCLSAYNAINNMTKVERILFLLLTLNVKNLIYIDNVNLKTDTTQDIQ